MKQHLLIANMLVVATTATAHAATSSLNLDLRFDYNSTTYNSDAGLPDYTKLYVKTGRIDWLGHLNADTDFRARLRFDKPDVAQVNTTTGVPANYQRDSLNDAIDYAYVAHKFTDYFKLTVGKWASEIGGFEGNTSPADLYLVSELYSGKGVTTGTVISKGINPLIFLPGVKATFNFLDTQEISLEACDQTTADPVDSKGNLDQTRGLAGIVYRAVFADKVWNLLASYHQSTPGNAKNTSDLDSYAALGMKYEGEMLMASVDLLMNTTKDGATGDKGVLSGIVGNIAYKGWEHWTPMIKLYKSQQKVDEGYPGSSGTYTSATTANFTGYSAVFEYRPVKEDIFRYHLNYNYYVEDPDDAIPGLANSNNKTKQEVVAGMRILADFLK